MRDLRIVFMGTPDFAVAILDRILNDGHKIVGVVTAPDKPAGRGRRLNESAVKKYAIEKGLHLLQPKNLKSPYFQNELIALNANIQVVVAFRMLPKSVWSLPAFGTFNLHASLLPDYRGAAPIHWAIINGEKKTGVTTFFIDEKIDTGEMILKKELEIENDETVGELHDRLMHLGAQAVSETLDLIQSDAVSTIKQPMAETKLAPKLFSDNCKVNWNNSLESIYNHIRGLNPFPAAWSEIKNDDTIINTKIYAVRKAEESHSLENGTIITSKKEIKVAVKNGFIILDELKLSGKKKMDAQSLLNGYTFSLDAKML
jgi:methionyl-tRNA formyltransferase